MLPYEHLRLIVKERQAALQAERLGDRLAEEARAGAGARPCGWRTLVRGLRPGLGQVGAWMRGNTWTRRDGGAEARRKPRSARPGRGVL